MVIKIERLNFIDSIVWSVNNEHNNWKYIFVTICINSWISKRSLTHPLVLPLPPVFFPSRAPWAFCTPGTAAAGARCRASDPRAELDWPIRWRAATQGRPRSSSTPWGTTSACCSFVVWTKCDNGTKICKIKLFSQPKRSKLVKKVNVRLSIFFWVHISGSSGGLGELHLVGVSANVN